MNELVINQTMSSREIADLTGKNHKDVLKAVRAMEASWVKVSQRNFALAEYIDTQGKPRPMYELTKTESLYVATKFNDEARAKLVIRWEELEKNANNLDFSNPDTVLMLVQNWKAEQTKRIVSEKKVEKLTPKVEFLDKAILACDTTVDIGQAAKILKLPYGRNLLFKKLREIGVFFKHRNEPKQEYVSRGYFEVFETPFEKNGRAMLNIKTVITQDGLLWLHTKLSGNMTQKQVPQFN